MSADGCSDDTTMVNYIEVYPQPDASYTVTYIDNLVVPVESYPNVVASTMEDIPIEFINTSDVDPNDNLTWHWDFGDGTTSTEANPEEHPYESWGEYQVTLSVTNENDCSSSVSYVVIVEAELKFTNVLTPNGDGQNDVFAIENMNPNFPNVLSVYDRWGKKVYEKENYQTYMKEGSIYNENEGFNPSKLSDGVYYFTFMYESYVKVTKYHSSLTIIRDK
jgi:gliding motility-associated-like protein